MISRNSVILIVEKMLLIAVILLSMFLRTFGINWDAGHHLHPDERFLSMAMAKMTLPSSLMQYLDPATSPLNPYNQGFTFFVYGTLPVTLNKTLAMLLEIDRYDGLAFLGRLLSAMADTGTLLWIYLIARHWEKQYGLNRWLKIFAASLYAIAVLPIQQSHFFTVDSFGAFFTMGAVYFAMRFFHEQKVRYTIASAVLMGCALASKISAIYILPLVALYIAFGTGRDLFETWSSRDPLELIKTFRNRACKDNLNLGAILRGPGLKIATIFAITTYIALRIGDPHIFQSSNLLNPLPNPKFVENLVELKHLSSPNMVFPPSLQWLNTTKILYPLTQVAVFGLGIPYFIVFLAGIYLAWQKRIAEFGIVFLWMLAFFVYQGSQFVLNMRYFYPLYPFIALFSAFTFTSIVQSFQRKKTKNPKISIVLITTLLTTIAAVLVWPVAFMSIYTQPNPRVEASRWIYRNIPKKSSIIIEEWDDPLPLPMVGPDISSGGVIEEYDVLTAPVFDPHSPAKRQKINNILEKGDYYIISSNRTYGSIMPLEKRFPYMSSVYEKLFSEMLGYRLIKEFTAHPKITIGLINLEFNDQWADESFTVYDHPRVMIYKKIQ